MKYKFLLLTLLIVNASNMYSMPRRDAAIKLFGFVKGYPATDKFTMVPLKMGDVQKFMPKNEALGEVRKEYWQAMGTVLTANGYSLEQAKKQVVSIKDFLDGHIEKSSIPNKEDFVKAGFNQFIAQKLHDELDNSYVMIFGGTDDGGDSNL